MIVDRLENSELYLPLGEGIAEGLRYLATFDPATGDGRHEIDGERVFALVQRYDTAPGAEKRFESHRLHADIQFVASGRERILRARSPDLVEETPYDEATDVSFYADPPASSSVLLGAGDFAVLFPDDAHKPGCMAGGRHAVRKVVVKIRL